MDLKHRTNMDRYIDADKLLSEIKKILSMADKEEKQAFLRKDGNRHLAAVTKIAVCAKIKKLITSLQQEQPEVDVVSAAKVFLDALSKTPYNNKPITDAQIIVKQLLLFFENPKEYNPNAILEQPEVDLEKVWDWIDETFTETEIDSRYGDSRNVVMSGFDICKSDLREKYERDFGLNARKEK